MTSCDRVDFATLSLAQCKYYPIANRNLDREIDREGKVLSIDLNRA